jgi:hypothetical protein
VSPGTSFQESNHCIDFILPTVPSYTKEQPPFNILTLEANFVLLVAVLQLARAPSFLKPTVSENSRAMFVAVRHPALATISNL